MTWQIAFAFGKAHAQKARRDNQGNGAPPCTREATIRWDQIHPATLEESSALCRQFLMEHPFIVAQWQKDVVNANTSNETKATRRALLQAHLHYYAAQWEFWMLEKGYSLDDPAETLHNALIRDYGPRCLSAVIPFPLTRRGHRPPAAS